MKIEKEMIDKDYRIGLRLSKIILDPTIKRYKHLNRLNSRLINKPLKKFISKQFYIKDKNSKNEVRVRVYMRKNHNHNCPGILFFHGGGFVLNYPENSHNDIKLILNNLDCVIVAPDYSKSLDNPYPAAINDSYQTLLWMKENSNKLGFNDNQLFTMGISAGGNLAISTALLARDLNEVSIAYQFVIAPMLDDRMTSESMRNHDGPIWNESQNRFAWNLYLQDVNEPVPYYAAPSRCENLIGLSPISGFIGDLDPFFDETKIFFERLDKIKIENKLKIFNNVYHGFRNVNPLAPKTIEAKDFMINELIKAKDTYFKEQPNS